MVTITALHKDLVSDHSASDSKFKKYHSISRFRLMQNEYKLILENQRRFLLTFLLPLVAGYILMSQATNIELSYKLITFFIAVIGLGICYIFRRKNKRSEGIELMIGEDEIEVYVKGECRDRLLITSLSYQMMGWGPHNNMLMPAVKIMVEGKKLMSIGLLSATECWSDHERYIQATDYMVDSKIIWKQLLASLKI